MDNIMDVIIIGAGVSGCAIARELSRYEVNCIVLEKGEDVCSGTSKANSGIVHAGYDAEPKSLMAEMNVLGNSLMEQLSKDLDFPFKRTGSLVVCLSEKDRDKLNEIYERGIKNNVPGLRIVERDELRAMEPAVSYEAVAALYAPTAGIVCPFGLNIALAENAYVNGVQFKFNTEVISIKKAEYGYEVETKNAVYKTKCVVNAAGVYADVFHNMVSKNKIHITPRKGEYCLMDKNVGGFVSHTIFALPNEKYGKGVLVTPTTHGNLLIGPTAEDIEDKEGINTTAEGLNQVITKAGLNVHELPKRQVITSFAGLRAHEDGHEFIIEEVIDAKGFIDCAGIESPGLTSCPAIGIRVADIVKDILKLQENPYFVPIRTGIINPEKLSLEQRNKLIEAQPAYGNIVCRCEMISEGEIIDAVRRPLGAKSLDGVKRRTRAGMGRCQAGFCSPKTMEIIARELKTNISDITKCGGNSKFIVGTNKDLIQEGDLHD